MKDITPGQNTAQTGPKAESAFGYTRWLFQFQGDDQIFEVKATTEQQDAGCEVGLVQLLVETSRVANYAGGGQLTITPNRPTLPVLDADPLLLPWYSQDSMATVEGADEQLSWKIADAPQNTFPSKAVDPDGNVQNIVSMEGKEIFVVIPYNKTTEAIIGDQKWSWWYEFKANSSGDSLNRPVLEYARAYVAEAVPYDGPLVLDGPVATQEPFTLTYSPGWKPVPDT